MNLKSKNRLLIASIALNAIFIISYTAKRIYYSNYNYFKYNKTNSYKVDSVYKTKPDGKEIYFLGTSITQSFNLELAFKNTRYINLGYAGSTTVGILLTSSNAIQRHPKAIIIEGGINDIRKGLSIDTAYENIKKIINNTKVRSPKTLIYIQSVLPTNSDFFNGKVILLNDKLKKLQSNGVIYMDVYPYFLDSGKLDQFLTSDGIHLNDLGYNMLRKVLTQYLKFK